MDEGDCLILSSLWEDFLVSPTPKKPQDLWKDHQFIMAQLEAVSANLPPFTRPNRYEKLDAFLEWADKMGIEHGNVEIGSNHGLSLLASTELNEHSLAVKVPKSAILSTEYAEQCESLKTILKNDEVAKSMNNVALAITLAHEILRGDESPWKPYLDILPENPATPIFYSEEELESLKPSPIFEETLFLLRAIARQFVYFYLQIHGSRNEDVRMRLMKLTKAAAPSHIFDNSPFTPENFTFDFYRWCVGVVSTRINVIPKVWTDGMINDELTASLIPFIDLANHDAQSSGAGTVYFDVEASTVNLGIVKRVSRGEEICMFYGLRHSGMFLLHNGFLPSCENPEDGFNLKIDPCALGMAVSDGNVYRADYLDRLGILQRVVTYKSFVYSFHLKDLDVDSIRKRFEEISRQPSNELQPAQRESLGGLWKFALAFTSSSQAELKTPGNSDLRHRAQKFLIDRLHIMILGYRDSDGDVNAPKAGGDSLPEYYIRKLKAFEKAILQKYSDALTAMKLE